MHFFQKKNQCSVRSHSLHCLQTKQKPTLPLSNRKNLYPLSRRGPTMCPLRYICRFFDFSKSIPLPCSFLVRILCDVVAVIALSALVALWGLWYTSGDEEDEPVEVHLLDLPPHAHKSTTFNYFITCSGQSQGVSEPGSAPPPRASRRQLFCDVINGRYLYRKLFGGKIKNAVKAE